MENTIINTQNINEVDFIQNRSGSYRAIIKGRGGFISVVDDLGILNNWSTGPQWKEAIEVFRNFRKGVLLSIEFKPYDSLNWFTVFARDGKTIKLMDRKMFMDMKVGDINQNWMGTNLYSPTNYHLCNAATWADKAFVTNSKNLIHQN